MARRKRIGKRSPLIIILSLVIALISFIYKTYVNKEIVLDNTVLLVDCVDGDTAKFIVNQETRTVRFLAIDTPETKKPNTPVQKYGPEASAFTCNQLKNAQKISLEFEKTRTDKYNRLLAWVFVDDELLQEKIVAEGLAKVSYLYAKYKYTESLKLAEMEAKNKKLNLWSESNEETK